MSQPFGYAEKPADTIIVTSLHALEQQSQREAEMAGREAVRQTGSAHPHTAASNATLIIRDLT